MIRRIPLLLPMLLTLLLAACASAPRRLYQAEQSPPADKALIYVYREARWIGGGVHYMVRAHGSRIAALPPGGYFPYYANPGKLELTAATEATASLTLEVKAGETYYVEGGLGIGVLIGHPRLALVPTDVGAKAIAGCTLVAGAVTTNSNNAPGSRLSSGHMGTAVVAINAAEIAVAPRAARSLPITVIDRRASIVLERTTVGHTAMSSVVLVPPESELLRANLSAKLSEVAARVPGTAGAIGVERDIDEFSITTPATLFYWDVTTDVAVTLRSGTQQQHLAAHATKRTSAWPSATSIRSATTVALKALAEQSGPALRAMLDAPATPVAP